MTDNTMFTTLPLPDGRTLQGDCKDDRLTLADEQGPLVQTRISVAGEILELAVEELRDEDAGIICALAYWALSAHPDCQCLQWTGLSAYPALHQALAARGLLIKAPSSEDRQTRREALWQQEGWLKAEAKRDFPEMLVVDHHVRHPLRPPKPVGEVYRRYDVQLGSWISFRTLDVEADLERFNRWQNKPRVNEFWEEAGTLDEHRAHLGNLAADPHCLQLIGCFDGEPFGFFDVYWAREDRIGPWCDAAFYDRGIHMLVGEDHHRGPHKIGCWLPSLVHYLFLDEPRTARIVSEPRSDNDRMIGHLINTGFSRLRDFNFPHKRAALMSLSRERFFDRCVLR